MNLKHASFFTMAILGLFLTSCEEDDGLNPDPDEKQGMFELEITDAPVDDPAIKSVMVTIADVQIDDQSLPDFVPVTLDLLTLQNGETAVLGSDSIKMGTYSEIALILDPDGCYVEDIAGDHHNLEPEDEKIELIHEFTLMDDSAVHLLIDFNLRKTIHRDLNDSIDRYDFVPTSTMIKGLRIFDKTKTGQLTGQCTDVSTGSDLIVVYAYKMGEFVDSVEINGTDESQVLFQKSVTSAKVQDDGKYNFPFLLSGEYELHFASYDLNGVTGMAEFKGLLQVNNGFYDDVLNILIEPSTTTTVDLAVTGLLPL